MIKKFSKYELATIKRTAQSVNPMVSKKLKIAKQINDLQAEYDRLTMMQEQYEASIKTMTGGYGTEDLLDKVIKTTGTDKNGKEIKVTSYVFKYPDTIIPSFAENIEEVSIDDVDGEDTLSETEYNAMGEPVDMSYTENSNFN